MKDETVGIVIILGIVFIALFGGVETSQNKKIFSPTVSRTTGSRNSAQEQRNISEQIRQTEVKVAVLKKQIQAEENKKTESVYKGIVTLTQLSHSTDPSREYLVLRVKSNYTSYIDISGWKLSKSAGGYSAIIPKGSYLFFSNVLNSEEDIYVTGNDTVYIVSSIPPNGVSFKVNKCTGYLTQFQSFTPSIGNVCPLARNEDTSSIARIVLNDSCFNYINSLPACRVPTKNLPSNFSYQCTRFIADKVNYPACINLHKNDPDFNRHEWRVYLKKGISIWNGTHDSITLYDNEGKIVSILKY